MAAIVLDAPGPPEALRIRELPIPVPAPGQVLIRVKAFGLNRSELHTRLGLAEGVTFPRVPGIEAAGVVAAAPGGEFAGFLDAVAAGEAIVPLDRTYRFDQIAQAHADMEAASPPASSSS